MRSQRQATIQMVHQTGSAAVVPPEINGTGAKCVRVLHVISGNLYGGVETLLVTLSDLRHLCPAMEPCFALCHEDRLSEELRASGVSVSMMGKVRISRPWTVWLARRRLRDLLRRERCDIVVCHMPWSLVIFGKAAREAGKKILFWAHGFHTGTCWLERLARLTTPDLIIANSRFTAGGVINLFPNVPRHVMYYPVALINSPEATHWRAVTRNEQGVVEDTVVIIQVGRLEEWKGHLLHLQALSLLKTATPWVCWIVGGAQKAGEEQYLRRLQETAVRLGIADRVRFLGQRSDVDRLLAGADIFCQPNLGAEPFGIVFVEALWAGRPVVTTAMGGPLEIIDSSCGLLVEPGNVSQLAASLKRLIESPELRGSLGRAGSTRALELCDPAAQMKSLSTLVRNAAGSSC